MADCLKCKNCIRQEMYDGQWGMFKYDKICSVDVRVIINGRLNPWDIPCNKLEYGEPKIVSMTEKEKQKYDPDFKEINRDKIFIKKTSEDMMVESVEALKKIGVPVHNEQGNFRPFKDILDDVSKVWKNLNDDKNNTYKVMEKVNNEWADFTNNNDLTGMDCNNYLDRQQKLKEQIKNIDIIQNSVTTNLGGIKDTNKFIKLTNKKRRRIDNENNRD